MYITSKSASQTERKSRPVVLTTAVSGWRHHCRVPFTATTFNTPPLFYSHVTTSPGNSGTLIQSSLVTTTVLGSPLKPRRGIAEKADKTTCRPKYGKSRLVYASRLQVHATTRNFRASKARKLDKVLIGKKTLMLRM